jgi:hypothetical protein
MEEFKTEGSGKTSGCCGPHAHKSLFKIFFCLATVFLFVLIVSAGAGALNEIKEWKYIGQGIEAKNTITVSDSGEIYAEPDLAITSFSVVTEAKTVAEAMSENTKKMNAVIAVVKGQGVEEKDLKTINFNISPHYDYYGVSSIYPSGKRVLVGYDITQTLQVKIRDLEKVGNIIQAAIDNGSNEASDLQFTIDQQDELKKQAREEAINKAKAKAEELADQLGVKLVRITNFSESNFVPYYALEKAASPLGLGGGGSAPQIETGENKIEVTVYITYEID